jgi:hypothetical protein
MFLFLTGAVLLAIIVSLFWMKDRLESPLLARFAYSGLVARMAVLGAVFLVLGILLMFSS